MDLLLWIVFLVGAPALLYWLWQGNRKRRQRWRDWCAAQGWRIEIDMDRGIGPAGVQPLPRFPVGQERLKHDSIDLRSRGQHRGADAVSWEWRMLSTLSGKRKHASPTGNTHHAIALRLRSPAPLRLFLVPRTMALLSLSAFLDMPDIESGFTPVIDGWRCHAHDDTKARAWLQANRAALERPHAPELSLLLVEGDWIVAWYLGETRPERIDGALQWLSTFDAPAPARA